MNSRLRFTPLPAAALMLCATPLALAGKVQPAIHGQSAGTAMPPGTNAESFDRAKLSLTQAIEAAQRLRPGKTLEAMFEMWQGKPAYLVRTYANGKVWEGRIDADSGRLMGQPRTVSTGQIHSMTVRKSVQALGKAHSSLTQAVSRAEQQNGGKAIMAEVESGPHGGAQYDLETVKDGKLRTALIDAQSGRFLAKRGELR